MNYFRKLFLFCGVLAALLTGTGNSGLFADESKDSRDGFQIGGALRYNIRYTDYDDDLDYPNNLNFKFDTFRIDVKGEKNGVLIDLQYRFYAYNSEIGADDGTGKTGFYTTLHHGWFGFTTGKSGQLELGVTQVPFGNVTYNSHNYYFSTNYYVGLEDDYDAGIKYHAKYGGLSVALAYFMEPEPGMGDITNRYSYDVTPNSDTGYSLNEKNQGNLRLAYTLGGVELGASTHTSIIP